MGVRSLFLLATLAQQAGVYALPAVRGGHRAAMQLRGGHRAAADAVTAVTHSPSAVGAPTTKTAAALTSTRGGAAATIGPLPQLLVVKCTMFMFYCTLGTLMPYLPVYYHSLGLSGMTIGRLGAITPAITFAAAPVWGALADRSGRRREIMIGAFCASIVARCSIASARSNVVALATLVGATAVLAAPVTSLLDSAVMAMLPDKQQYGTVRVWGQLGFGCGSFAIGPVLARSTLGCVAAARCVALRCCWAPPPAPLTLPPRQVPRRVLRARPPGRADRAGDAALPAGRAAARPARARGGRPAARRTQPGRAHLLHDRVRHRALVRGD